jgi:hypothetical protein
MCDLRQRRGPCFRLVILRVKISDCSQILAIFINLGPIIPKHNIIEIILLLRLTDAYQSFAALFSDKVTELANNLYP